MKTILHTTARPARLWRRLSALALVAAAGFSPLNAAEPSPADTLELGIYTEETKGEIDAAIELYRKVIADSVANRAVAAQAQFRLGICLDKKTDYAGATAAFETVVRDYPEQKELVKLANEYLADGAILLPAPWEDGEELRFDVRIPGGARLGSARYSITSGEVDGRRTWKTQSHLFASWQQEWGQAEVDARTFKPIRSRTKAGFRIDSKTTFEPGRAALKMQGKDKVKKIDLNGVVYDFEGSLQLVRRLPLTSGYKTQAFVYVGAHGGTVSPMQLEVAGVETLEVPAGTFECFKVGVPAINQTLWYSTDARPTLVKLESAGGVLELASIGRRRIDEPTVYVDPRFNFEVEAPGDWLIEYQSTNEDLKRSLVAVLDPDAIGIATVKVENAANFDPADRASPRAFANHQIEYGKKFVKGFAVHPKSWVETSIAGQPAVSFAADGDHSGIRIVILSAFAFVDDKAVEISATVPAGDLEAYRTTFARVLAGYRVKRQ